MACTKTRNTRTPRKHGNTPEHLNTPEHRNALEHPGKPEQLKKPRFTELNLTVLFCFRITDNAKYEMSG